MTVRRFFLSLIFFLPSLVLAVDDVFVMNKVTISTTGAAIPVSFASGSTTTVTFNEVSQPVSSLDLSTGPFTFTSSCTAVQMQSCAAGSVISLNTQGRNTMTFTTSGTWAGTMAVDGGTCDGTGAIFWTNIPAVDNNPSDTPSNNSVLTFTDNDPWIVPVGGFCQARVRMQALASGSPQVDHMNVGAGLNFVNVVPSVPLGKSTPLTVNVTASGETVAISSPGANTSLYISKIIMQNAGSADVTVSLKNGSGGTTVFKALVGANGGSTAFVQGGSGWRLSPNTQLIANLSATGNVDVNVMEYYIAP